jgi:hypothetical protein
LERDGGGLTEVEELRHVFDALREGETMCVSEEEVACLMTPLRHHDPQIRCLALAFIPHLVQDGDHRVLTPILVLLSCDQSPLVRAAAAAAIGHMCPYGHQLSGQAVTALIKAISQADQHPSISANSCEALQHIAAPKDTTAWKAIAAWHQRQEAEEERNRTPLTADEIARIRSLSRFAIGLQERFLVHPCIPIYSSVSASWHACTRILRTYRALRGVSHASRHFCVLRRLPLSHA